MKFLAAFAYADRAGVIGFGTGRRAPKGTIVFARHRDLEQLKLIVDPVARHAYDGKTLLVPGVPETADDGDALEAFERWRDWSFQRYGQANGAVLITDDANEVAR